MNNQLLAKNLLSIRFFYRTKNRVTVNFAVFLINLCLGITFFELHAEADTKETLPKFSQMQFYSQASQDQFAYTILYDVLKKKDAGYYLEIGSADPIFNSNTYFFEQNCYWDGVSLDIEPKYQELWYGLRNNLLLIEDSTKANYASILQSFPQVIDYLSLDIDRSYEVVLEQIPFKDYIFKVITIEHDFYRFGDIYREREREILRSFDYYLLCPDVLHIAVGSFEDWWIHPSAFTPSTFQALTSLDLATKDHQKIIEIIKTLSN